MSDLVILQNGTPVTTTLAIAEGAKRNHSSILKLVRRYQADLEEFGLVGFEIQARSLGQHGGGDTEYAILNERQSTLLLTYLRNSEIVRAFKKRLVRKFYEMAEALKQPTPKAALPQITALEYVDRITAKLPSLGETALQQLYSEASEIDLGRRLIPLPIISEPFYTASELAAEFGVTPNKIGRIANACGLKSEEFGEYRLSKSKYSPRQIEQFFYNEKGRAALALMLVETTAEVN